jgi:hypothetical protein
MHRYNNKYGYGAILREYCGVDPTTPIWGEVQHSLFMNIRYFTANGRLGPPREQLKRFPRLLSWQNLLPFPHQVAIGDPLLYSSLLTVSAPEPVYPGLPFEEFSVFMPKLNDEVPLPDRFDTYLRGALEAIDLSAPTAVMVALHPREFEHRDKISRHLSGVAETVWTPADYPGGSTAWSNHLIAQAKNLTSDYFGAHVFRASAYFGKSVSLVGHELFNPGFHPVMTAILNNFMEAEGDMASQRAVSEQVLGVGHQRSQEELTSILGFLGWKKLAGRPVRVVYQRVRRARIRHRRRNNA